MNILARNENDDFLKMVSIFVSCTFFSDKVY